ncbi:hypothetical protein DMC47_04405 [Nostoc sp. 3335mG]|nr:hypothetical protein DMC47_04405 [Nostoc sp. 3335mG]
MTFLVKEISVRGFQNYRNITVPIWDDVNFIIGRNGSGKTSFVRLLHASLNLDATELLQSQFDSIEIKFKDTDSKRIPILSIEKDKNRSSVIEISFRPHSKAVTTRYFVDEDDGEPSRVRIAERNILAELLSRQSQKDGSLRPLSELRRSLRRNLQFSWLPLLRSRVIPRRPSEYYSPEFVDEPINRKIRELLGQITSFLAILDTRVSEANKKFQRSVFVSYIRQGLFDVRALQRLDMHTEQAELLRMLNEMEYPISDIAGHIDSFFEKAEKTKTSVIPGQPSMPVTDVVNVVTANALHRIVSSFGNYTNEKLNILYPQAQFIELLNGLLYRKEVYFDEGNVLKVREAGQYPEKEFGDRLELFDLSSGEKQLLVILSETLLQQRRQFVFIADEPELSLHVEWQEKLVQTIRQMNENAQIIFATHSPDIVSIYQDRVINFEQLD